jgi:hypothetical protein
VKLVALNISFPVSLFYFVFIDSISFVIFASGRNGGMDGRRRRIEIVLRGRIATGKDNAKEDPASEGKPNREGCDVGGQRRAQRQVALFSVH